MVFMGEYNNTLDEKGRLIIPAKFREGLGDEFVITRGMDGCLFVFDKAEWERINEKLHEGPVMTDKDARRFARFFIGGAVITETNKSGRVLIPAHLREYAGIRKEAVLIGVGPRIEIWSRESFEGSATFDDMDEIAQHLSNLGIGF